MGAGAERDRLYQQAFPLLIEVNAASPDFARTDRRYAELITLSFTGGRRRTPFGDQGPVI